jgi:CheY-like chemotaxis protein
MLRVSLDSAAIPDSVSPRSGPDDRVVVRFEVRDTGIGIDAEARSRLFQAFSQADGSTTRRYGGTGLGLTISRQLVELMGGEIGLDSEAGLGSTFWLTVPLAPAATAGEPRPMLSGEHDGARVLIVDDNATSRSILERQLRAWGLQTDGVEDGAGALLRLRDAPTQPRPYDLVLIDLNMPGLDGLGLASRINALTGACRVPMVLMCPVGAHVREVALRQCGIAATLTKPIGQAQLFETVRTILRTASESLPPPARPGRPFIVVNQESQVGSRHRVLVAEDNPVNQRVAARMLERLGIGVDIASDGQEAVHCFGRESYDAILMDCQMPGIDGFEATARIRLREGSAHHTPIIAMTASAMQGDRERCLAAGMDDYLSKPVTLDSLRAVLDRWLPAAVDASETTSERSTA